MGRRTVRQDSIWLTRTEPDKLYEQRLGIRRGKLLIDDIFAECIEHLDSVDICVWVSGLYILYTQLCVTIRTVLPKTAEWAHKPIVILVVIDREKHTTAMVELVAELTRDFGVVEQVGCASTTDAACPIQPVLVDVLAKRKLWPPTLLRANGHGKFGQDAVEAREVEAKGDFRVRRYCELNLE